MAKVITLEQAKATLKAALAGLESEKATIDELKAKAAGNLMLLMTSLMPKIVEIIGPVVVPMGFTADQPGLMQFMGALNAHNADPEIAAGKMQIMATMSGK